MIPTRLTLWIAGVLAITGIVVSFFPEWHRDWQWLALGLLGLVALDSVMNLFPVSLTIHRHIPRPVPLNESVEIRVTLENRGSRTLDGQLYDHHPAATTARGLPLTFRIKPKQETTVGYTLRANERGDLGFGQSQCRVRSPLGFWLHNLTVGKADAIRVFPNFAVLGRYSLLAARNRRSYFGIHPGQRRGEGTDFEQMREYREGDSARQLDWKTSARMHKLVSRDFREQRDQDVVFMLDSGQRMRARDGDLSHFDHALDALLLLSDIALKQGDAVGLTTFSGQPVWIKPAKSAAALKTLVNAVYALQPSTRLPDYLAAAKLLQARQRRRALIIVITNVRDSEEDELQQALDLLRQHHLVLLANLRESALDQSLSRSVNNFPEALDMAATHLFQAKRQEVMEQMQRRNALVLDAAPRELGAELVNRYLRVKAAEQL